MDWLIFDFETLHNVPWNTSVISLAFIAGNWDEVTFESIEKNGIDFLKERGEEYFFDLKNQKTAYDRVIGEETKKWWESQSKEAKDRVFRNNHEKHDLSKLPELFSEYCKKHGVHKDTKILLRGPDFDHTIMLSIFGYFNRNLPYNHWNLRDIRTIVDVVAGSGYIFKFNDYCNTKFDLVAHDALHDCIRDILQVSFVLQNDSSVLKEDYKKYGMWLKEW